MWGKQFFFAILYVFVEWLKSPLHNDISASYLIILPTWWGVLTEKQLNKSSWHGALLLYGFQSDAVTHHWVKKKIQTKNNTLLHQSNIVTQTGTSHRIESQHQSWRLSFWPLQIQNKKKKEPTIFLSKSNCHNMNFYFLDFSIVFNLNHFYGELIYIPNTICVDWLLFSLK